MTEFDGPTGLDTLIPELVSHKSWQTRLHLHQVFVFWNDVVGADISRRAQPQVIKGTVLWVGVSDSMWMQQLQFETQYLMEALNARLDACNGGEGRARSEQQEGLRLTGVRLSLDPSLVQWQHPSDALLPSPTVDQGRLQAFSGLLSSIADPELRESMIRVWLAMHRGRQQG